MRRRPSQKRTPRYGRRLGWYATVRATKPRLIVETGIHDGLGSVLLLRALQRNAEDGHPGNLVSLDVKPDAGWLVGDDLAAGWARVVGSSFDELERALAGRAVDVFIHDSDHTYRCERFEFDVAVAHRAERTVLISDNAHATSALRDVAIAESARFQLFMEEPVDHFYPGAGLGLVVLEPVAPRG